MFALQEVALPILARFTAGLCIALPQALPWKVDSLCDPPSDDSVPNS
jgi:hypothetical protein